MRFIPRLVFLTICIFLVVACQADSANQEGPLASEETADELDTAVSSMLTETPELTMTPELPATQTPLQTTPVPEPTQTASETESTTTADTVANADVIFVKAVQSSDGSWTFHVTVSHPDTGWEDYADGWDVLLPDGTVLKRSESDTFTRLLLHPHETEQPFTRSQSGLIIPAGITQVTVRAHDLVDGFGGEEITVDLTAESGKGFEVETTS